MRGEIIQNYHLTFRYLENIILYTLIIIIVLFLRIPLPCQENNSNELFNSQCAIYFIPNFFFRYTTVYYYSYYLQLSVCCMLLRTLDLRLENKVFTTSPPIYTMHSKHTKDFFLQWNFDEKTWFMVFVFTSAEENECKKNSSSTFQGKILV